MTLPQATFGHTASDFDELTPRNAVHPPERTSEPAGLVAPPAPVVPRHFRETVGPKTYVLNPRASDPAVLAAVRNFLSGEKAATTPKPVGLAGDSAKRKESPVYEGFMCYFPNAIANVAKLSKLGNDKHNPGQALHWSFNLSNDHGDCLSRHQMNAEEVDPSYNDPEILHATAVAWRAMAQLETILLKKHPELQPGKNVRGAR